MALIFIFSLCVYSSVKGDEPGGPEDPLTSKSYVDAKINELNQKIAELENSPSAGFVPVNLKAGQICVGHAGAEIILRGGTGKIYSRVPDGLVNATAGAELFGGDSVPLNNLLIVSRADGRGISVSENSWLIVRGGYDILN